MEMDNLFDVADSLVEISAEPIVEEKKEERPFYVVKALQIIKLKKTSIGHSREIVDTFKVVGDNIPYHRVNKKAEMIGECIVVEIGRTLENELIKSVYKVYGNAKIPLYRNTY